jgi:hypothetical protein
VAATSIPRPLGTFCTTSCEKPHKTPVDSNSYAKAFGTLGANGKPGGMLQLRIEG